MKDVFNKMLGFEAAREHEIDTKSEKKSSPPEGVEKIAKINQKVSEKGLKRLPTSIRKSNLKSYLRKQAKKHGF